MQGCRFRRPGVQLLHPNHQRTTRGRGTRARPTPLPPDWQPGEAGEAYARRLGLDPVPLAQRFRKTFTASGKCLADWAQRWALWCDEDAGARRTTAASAAPHAGLPVSRIERDAQGLTKSDRSFLAKWEAKMAADEHPGQLEELLGRVLSAEGRAELRRRQALTRKSLDRKAPEDISHLLQPRPSRHEIRSTARG